MFTADRAIDSDDARLLNQLPVGVFSVIPAQAGIQEHLIFL